MSEKEKEVILTRDGYNKLLDELTYLETKRRKEVAERIKDAIGFGDLSENSEYDDAKNEQAFVEGRIAQINEMLSLAKVIEDNGNKSRKVSLGSYVVLLDVEYGEEQEYQIVGSVEADPTNHKISNESPVGRAIMGKKAGDVVQVRVPEGFLEYKILKVKKNSSGK
ncbi:MAG: transcription elongation factor GreA [Actinomycetota bacterium]|nr:transcription elongation factor GreA [Actinomycetota bacterium]